MSTTIQTEPETEGTALSLTEELAAKLSRSLLRDPTGKLLTERIPLSLLLEDPANARIHPDRNLRHLMSSLTQFGQMKPLVISLPKENGYSIIHCGNGAFRAMQALGWTECDVIRTTLTGPEAMAYAIADNQIALTSDWDFENLAGQMQSLKDWNPEFDFDGLGFEEHEWGPLMSASFAPPPVAAEDEENNNSSSPPEMGQAISVTAEQRETIDRAINLIRLKEQEQEMSEGRALELIAADFIADPNNFATREGHFTESRGGANDLLDEAPS